MNFKEMFLKGIIPENILLYDAHAHIDSFPATATNNGSAEKLLFSMDTIGIKETAISSTRSIIGDFVSGNNAVLDAVKNSDGRIKGYVTINPQYENGTIEEIKRCKADGMVGIKIHPPHCGTPLSSPLYEETYKYANENGMIILIHTWSHGDIAELEKAIKKYPDAKFILAHSGADTGYPITAEVIRKYENAYCDFCMGLPRANLLEHLVEYGDENKILYGTDFPLSDQRIIYGRVMLTDIPDRVKEKIMGLNYLELFANAKL